MHQEIGVGNLFERRSERLDELVRQAAHEPDRVREQHRLATRQPQPAHGGIEGGEQAVLHEDVGVGQPVEQRRLPRVRVPHERDGGERAATARLALRVARAGELLEVLLELGDAPLDAPPVDFELRLAGTSSADAATLL